MANQLSSSGKTSLWHNPDLRKRVLFLLGALIVFRIGAHVPVPGVDAAALAKLYQKRCREWHLGHVEHVFRWLP